MEDTKNLQTDKKNKDYKINTNKSLQYPSCYNNSSVMECANEESSQLRNVII